MRQITYTLASLCERIEEMHGRITKPFTLQYPTDPRCKFTLRILVECEHWQMMWYEATNSENVSELIGMDVVGLQWNQYDNDHILTVVVR